MPVLHDLPYGATAAHQCDVYVPATPEPVVAGSWPVCVFVHGGGWQRGDRKNRWRGAPVFAQALADRGVVVVAVGYRLAPSSFAGVCLRSTLLSVLCASLGCWWTDSNWLEQFTQWWLLWFALWLIWNYALARCRNLVRHPHQVSDIAQAVQWVRDQLPRHVPAAHTADGVVLAGHSAGAHLVSLLHTDPTYLTAVGVSPAYVRGVVSVSGIYTLSAPVSGAC
jgi:acetyl esterase/lipase